MNNDKGATNVEGATPVATNTPAALLRKALQRAFSYGQDYWALADSESYKANKKADAVRAKFDALVEEAIVATTAPGASESRGSVPDADALRAAFPLFDDNGLSETEHCCEWSMQQDRKRLHAMLAATTPPAVSNEEGAFTARVVEWKGIRFGVPAQIAKSFMAALEGTNGEPPDWAIAQAVRDTTVPAHDFAVVQYAGLVLKRANELLARSAAAKGEG